MISTLLLSVGWMVALIFLMDDRLDSLENTKYAKALEESQMLAMVHCVFVGSAIPMLLDVFLDFVDLRLRKKSTDEPTLVHLRTRVLLLLSNLAVTSVYGGILLFGNSAALRKLGAFYVLSTYIAKITIIMTIMLPIMTLGIVPHVLVLAGGISQFVGAPLKLICFLAPNYTSLALLAKMIINFSRLMYVVGFFVWGRDLWARYIRPQEKNLFKWRLQNSSASSTGGI